MRSKQFKVFVGPVEIAGYYANLTKGFEKIGINCNYITYNPHPFNYAGETTRPLLLYIANWFRQFKLSTNRFFLLRVLVLLPSEFLLSIWGVYAIFHYDVFIFGFGKSLLRKNIDLPILKVLGKTVISNIAHGSEARPAFIDSTYQSKDGVHSTVKQIHLYTRRGKHLVVHHQKYASFVIGAPFSTSQFAQSHFINLFALGLPFQSIEEQTRGNQNIYYSMESDIIKPIRILHSPSHPTAKGSPVIIQAVENLKQRGYDIEFVLIHGRPFNEVLIEIQRCDFVVDQLYSDTPMAGFATESAWFGKPAVVGGYGFELLQQFIPEGMWPPSKICHPDRIEQAIEELIVDVEQRKRLGREAQMFVRKKWNAVEVARRFLRLIEGDIPNEWWLDPKEVIYLEGGGQSVERTKQLVRGLVDKYGVESLQLLHRPDLEKAFIEFAGIHASH